MKLAFEEFLGSKPFLYGRDLLKRMGVRGHLVDERDVADFLGLEIKEITAEHYEQFPDLGTVFDDSCAHLLPEHRWVLIGGNMPKVRKRTSTFHEFGHDIYPFHAGNAFSCNGKDIDPAAHKQMEKEAFLCGSEIMLPLKPFVEDSSSVALGHDSIKKISRRYKGSFEATAIRYAYTNQNVMAILVVQPNVASKHESAIVSNDHPDLPFAIPHYVKPNGKPPAPLRVQYFVRSFRFPKFISSGTEIREDNLIYESWKYKVRRVGEIQASKLGSSQTFSYFVECSPFDETERVMAILWLQNRQGEFWRGVL